MGSSYAWVFEIIFARVNYTRRRNMSLKRIKRRQRRQITHHKKNVYPQIAFKKNCFTQKYLLAYIKEKLKKYSIHQLWRRALIQSIE